MNLIAAPVQRTWWQFGFGLILPMSVFFMAVLLDAMPLATGTARLYLPNFAVPVLFYWAANHPRSVPVLLIVAVGLGFDALHGAPLSVHALGFLAVVLFAKSQSEQLSNLGLVFNWIFFSMALVGFVIVKFFITLVGTPDVFAVSLWPAILSSAMTVLTTLFAFLPIYVVLRWLDGLFLYRARLR